MSKTHGPALLSAGKRFHQEVQEHFAAGTKDGTAHPEKAILLQTLRRGRADVYINGLGDFVTILEVKNTNWDRIKPQNIRKNLYSHQRQIFKYIDSIMEKYTLDVCLGIIYPAPPQDTELRARIEQTMTNDYGVPVYWFTEIK